ncbi:MAG: nucleotide exchange factor GrpE [Gammaproteobacteria bacterium]|jgi:molecular chaperone GrpE|nr:nucleotide exchange factor GrpE [Gammaproteobacteria bacterium]MBT4492882.1 nucleotide exchange factor GrpE [Gammaproteobacteria bacterium]MBT7371290.1 nucleotide exchange factor GrpE [Gammaproteobacteria bacterium]
MSLPEEEAKENDTTSGDESHEVTDVQEETSAEEAEEKASTEPLTPEAALEKAQEEVLKFKDLALRAEAELQNMQRRTTRDVENAHKFGLERFLQNLLPVVDSLEKAIEASEQASDEASGAIAEGVSLCHKLLIDVLGKESVEVIDPVGEPFDPNEHQAMSIVENPEMEPNSVFAVVQKGYKLNGRLVRAAMVMVTKAPQTAENARKTDNSPP